jgi:hypothetical protein
MNNSKQKVKVHSAIPVLLFIMGLLLHFNFTNGQANTKKDSARIAKQLPKVFPIETKRDYKRFEKYYSNEKMLSLLINGNDSAVIKKLLGNGLLLNQELFQLTFSLSDSSFHYALLYKNNFSRFKVKDNVWYLSEFAVIFNKQSKVYKLFEHQMLGYNLFDKRKFRSI